MLETRFSQIIRDNLSRILSSHSITIARLARRSRGGAATRSRAEKLTPLLPYRTMSTLAGMRKRERMRDFVQYSIPNFPPCAAVFSQKVTRQTDTLFLIPASPQTPPGSVPVEPPIMQPSRPQFIQDITLHSFRHFRRNLLFSEQQGKRALHALTLPAQPLSRQANASHIRPHDKFSPFFLLKHSLNRQTLNSEKVTAFS